MAKKRPSPVALVQSYFADGLGAESTGLLASVNTANDALHTQSADHQANDETVTPITTTKPLITTPLIGMCAGTHSGTHTGIDIGIQSYLDADTHAGVDADMDTGVDVGLDAYRDKPRYQEYGIDAGLGANKQASIYANTHTGTVLGTHSGTHKGTLSGIQSNIDAGTDTGPHIYMHIDPKLWYPFTENQGKVLLYLIEAGGKTNRNYIERDTGVPLSSVAKVLAILEQHGYIKRAEHKHYQHRQRGFYYSIITQNCTDFYERIRGRKLSMDSGMHTSTHTGTVTGVHLGTGSGTHTGIQSRMNTAQFKPISSSRESITSTTPEPPDQTDQLKDPELVYWTEKGVNNRQISKWVDEFQIPVEQLIQCLKYCRFEMVVLNIEDEKQINSPLSWFYKVMQRSGVYPKPNGYKSLIEIRAEMMEQAAREAAEVRERQEKAERDLAFQTILSKPDSAEYQALYSRTSDLAREMGGKMLALALRDAFNKERGIASDESQG